MPYFSCPEEIKVAIAQLSQAQMLWLDTEIADYQTKQPRLALLQVLPDYLPPEVDAVLVFDLLNCPDLIECFIAQIMANPAIAKVAHNMKFDQRFLGRDRGQNLICTQTWAQAIPYYLLPVPNYQLKTLVEHFAIAIVLDKTQQGSDWGERPLSSAQLQYAACDAVYLARLFPHLQQLHQQCHPDPAQEDLTALILRYRRLTHQWRTLDSERKHLEVRLKAAMQIQAIPEQGGIVCQRTPRTTRKVSFQALAEVVQSRHLTLDFAVNLTQELMKKLGKFTAELPIEETISASITIKEKAISDDDLPF